MEASCPPDYEGALEKCIRKKKAAQPVATVQQQGEPDDGQCAERNVSDEEQDEVHAPAQPESTTRPQSCTALMSEPAFPPLHSASRPAKGRPAKARAHRFAARPVCNVLRISVFLPFISNLYSHHWTQLSVICGCHLPAGILAMYKFHG